MSLTKKERAARAWESVCVAEAKAEQKAITTPEDISNLVASMHFKRVEVFAVLTLNGGHALIKKHEITKGLVNRTIVHPREIFFPAIKDMAASIVLVHNHPSGQMEPSPEDISITKRLVEAGELLGIPVLDHVIVGKGNFCSLARKGLL